MAEEGMKGAALMTVMIFFMFLPQWYFKWAVPKEMVRTQPQPHPPDPQRECQTRLGRDHLRQGWLSSSSKPTACRSAADAASPPADRHLPLTHLL